MFRKLIEEIVKDNNLVTFQEGSYYDSFSGLFKYQIRINSPMQIFYEGEWELQEINQIELEKIYREVIFNLAKSTLPVTYL